MNRRLVCSIQNRQKIQNSIAELRNHLLKDLNTVASRMATRQFLKELAIFVYAETKFRRSQDGTRFLQQLNCIWRAAERNEQGEALYHLRLLSRFLQLQ